MYCKILHLNINGGNYFQALTKFLQANDFDILCLQEITGLHTYNGNISSPRDVFEALSKLLADTHHGELAISQRFSSDKKNAYVGNGIFFKHTFTLFHKHIVQLVDVYPYFSSESEDFKHIGRNFLHLTLEKQQQRFEIVTTHLPWANSPEEHGYQKKYNKVLIDYIKTISRPFILTGDFNITADQPTPKKLEQYGINLTRKFGASNTLDPQHHRVKELFPPGVAVDFIYVSKDVRVIEFEVLENEHISDHLGLTVTLEIALPTS